MATNTKGHPTRELPDQAVHFMRKTVNYNDAGISTGVGFSNWLPAGAEILRVTVKIKTAFNAGTTNVLTVGQNSSSYNDMVASGDVDATVQAMTIVLRGGDLDLTAADAQPFIKYVQTGGAASAGKATVIIEYVPNNDQ